MLPSLLLLLLMLPLRILLWLLRILHLSSAVARRSSPPRPRPLPQPSSFGSVSRHLRVSTTRRQLAHPPAHPLHQGNLTFSLRAAISTNQPLGSASAAHHHAHHRPEHVAHALFGMAYPRDRRPDSHPRSTRLPELGWDLAHSSSVPGKWNPKWEVRGRRGRAWEGGDPGDLDPAAHAACHGPPVNPFWTVCAPKVHAPARMSTTLDSRLETRCRQNIFTKQGTTTSTHAPCTRYPQPAHAITATACTSRTCPALGFPSIPVHQHQFPLHRPRSPIM